VRNPLRRRRRLAVLKSLRLLLGGAESSKRSGVRIARNLCGGGRNIRCPELVTCETNRVTVAVYATPCENGFASVLWRQSRCDKLRAAHRPRPQFPYLGLAGVRLKGDVGTTPHEANPIGRLVGGSAQPYALWIL
jgi:hypothetical protein